jgi:hypothetical protein
VEKETKVEKRWRRGRWEEKYAKEVIKNGRNEKE